MNNEQFRVFMQEISAVMEKHGVTDAYMFVDDLMNKKVWHICRTQHVNGPLLRFYAFTNKWMEAQEEYKDYAFLQFLTE